MSTDERPRVRFWRPDTPSVTAMFRVDHEDHAKTTYAEHFMVAVVYEGAFDGWYRGAVRAHVSGSLKLKEPGEVHRDLRVHAPFTIQGAAFAPELVAAAADATGLRGPPHFKASGFAPGEPATRLAFAMHDALVRDDASEIEHRRRLAGRLREVLRPIRKNEPRSPKASARRGGILGA